MAAVRGCLWYFQYLVIVGLLLFAGCGTDSATLGEPPDAGPEVATHTRLPSIPVAIPTSTRLVPTPAPAMATPGPAEFRRFRSELDAALIDDGFAPAVPTEVTDTHHSFGNWYLINDDEKLTVTAIYGETESEYGPSDAVMQECDSVLLLLAGPEHVTARALLVLTEALGC